MNINQRWFGCDIILTKYVQTTKLRQCLLYFAVRKVPTAESSISTSPRAVLRSVALLVVRNTLAAVESRVRMHGSNTCDGQHGEL